MSDNLARTIRDFNGFGVGRFPLPGELSEHGVYALYCTSNTGIYGRYGQSVNDCCYDVPVYVGCSILSACSRSFAEQSLSDQLKFWQSAIRRSIDLNPKDFCFRWYEFAKPAENMKLTRALRKLYHPVWNEVFDDAVSQAELLVAWAEYHDMRFRPRCHIPEVECRRATLQTLLQKVG